MMRNNGPCRSDCPDRCAEPNCHMTCEPYLEFIASEKERRTKIIKSKAAEAGARGFRVQQAEARRRRRNGR